MPDELTPAYQEPSIVTISARTAVILLLFTIAFTGLMASMHQLTKDTIEASAIAEKMRLIGEVLPPTAYDNDLLKDWVELPPTAALGLEDSSRVYRARRAGKPVALVLEAAAPDGYSGHIGLLLGVRAGGELNAVRVTQHRETPGLGDYIDPKKDKNKAHPWISQFDGQGFAQVPPAEWAVRRDGGRFDQHTGATISARAVTNAVGRALKYVNEQRDRLYGAPAQSKF